VSKRRVNVPHAAIAEYWAPRIQLLAHATWNLDELAADTCFACQFDCRGRRPQRHHIIPYEFSKDDGLANLHLLCERCHREAPHTPDASIYWAWFRHKEMWLDSYTTAAANCFRMLELDEEKCEAMLPILEEGGVELLEKIGFQSPGRTSIQTLMLAYMTRLWNMSLEGDQVTSPATSPEPQPEPVPELPPASKPTQDPPHPSTRRPPGIPIVK
jgi:hypothetical protein